MSLPKLHHYVPQFHLRRFTDSEGRLWTWDKRSDRIFRTSPRGIAAEKQFYRLTQYEADGHDPLTMEKQLSDMEGEVSLITDQWLEWLPQMKPLDKVPIPRINRWIVARYLAVQMLRTLDTRELLSAMVEVGHRNGLLRAAASLISSAAAKPRRRSTRPRASSAGRRPGWR